MEDDVELHFDGECRGNPGPGAAGWVVSRAGQEVASGHTFLDEETTHSVAKFSGLIFGLRAAIDLGVRRLRVKGHSEVVVYTVRGVLRVRQDHLMPQCERALALASRFESLEIERVPKELNTRATDEATRGFSRRLRDINVVVARGGYDPLPWTDRGRGRPARWKSDSVEIVNPYTGARRPLPSMPAFTNPLQPDYDEDFGDVDVRVATLDCRLYLVGGETVSRSYTGGVRSLDLSTGAWTRHASLPDPDAYSPTSSSAFRKRTGCAVVATGGSLFQIGGKVVDESCGDAYACHETDVYDVKRDRWSAGPRTGAPRMHASAVACDGLVYVVGGTGSVIADLDGFENYGPSQQHAVEAVEVLDPRRRPLAWQTIAPLPARLAGVVLVAYDGIIFAIGGQRIDYESPERGARCRTRYVRTVYALDVSAGPDLAVWDSLQKLPVATAYADVFPLGHGLFCVASSGHADLIIDVRRSQLQGDRPRCHVVREGWPRNPRHDALYERHSSGVCLGAERGSRAALGLVDLSEKSERTGEEPTFVVQLSDERDRSSSRDKSIPPPPPLHIEDDDADVLPRRRRPIITATLETPLTQEAEYYD